MHARIVGNVFERDSVFGKTQAVGGGMSLPPLDYTRALLEAFIAGNVFRSNFTYGTGREGAGGFAGGVYVWGKG